MWLQVEQLPHQSWVASYFPCVLIFSEAFQNNIIYVDSLLLVFDSLWEVKTEYMV